MKRIKKLLFIGCILFAHSSFSQQTVAPITTITSATACLGDTVSLDVTVRNFNCILAFGVRMEYDTTQLKYLSVTNKNVTLSSYGFIQNFDSDVSGTTRMVKVAWTEGSFTCMGLTTDSVLFTLNFIYQGGGNASITFNNNALGGVDCAYGTTGGVTLVDTPTSTYYIDGTVSLGATPSQPSVITGNAAPCFNTSQSYSIQPVANATGYTWTLPAGWTITSGGGTTSIMANVGASGGTIAVTADNSCGSSPQSTKTVTINDVPAQPGAITGNTPVCAGTSQTYSILPVSGATSYSWNYAGTLLGSTSNSVTFSPMSSGQLVVTANNNCGPSASQTLNLTVNPQTVINTHPQDQFGAIGTTVNFSVSASGTGLTYQWQDSCSATGWDDISLATDSTYSFLSDTLDIGCRYRCIVTGICGTITSQSAVYEPSSIIITQHPVSQTVCEGSQVTFTVDAVGSGTLSYQWEKDCGSGYSTITGATSKIYTITTVTLADSCSYRCVVSNGVAVPATSSAAILTVNPLIQIIGQPQPVSTCENVTATFTVAASNVSAYQWQISTDGGTTWGNVSGGAYSGEQTSTLTINPVASSMDGDVFRCLLTAIGTCDEDTTNQATLTITGPLVATVTISASPSNNICTGTNVTFTATPQNGGTSPAYQWYLNGNAVGSGGSTYSNSSLADGDTVYCVLTSSDPCVPAPATSNNVIMSVDSDIPIADAGNDTTVCEGDDVTLTATGGTTYLWSEGSTTASIVVSPIITTTYSVTVYNGACSDEDNVIVSVDNCSIDDANAFTPDGDGFNDIFMPGVDLTVFDRWGLELYSGTDGWDGKYNGKDVAPGSYFFIAKLMDDSGNVIREIKSAVMVVRK